MTEHQPTPIRERVFLFLGLAGVLVASIALVAFLCIPKIQEARQLRKVRAHAYLLAASLQSYVKQNHRFPNRLEELFANARAGSPLDAPEGCFDLYIKPAPNAPPKSTVVVIRYGDKQAIIRKDFHMLIWP